MKYGRVILADKHQDMLEGIRGLLETTFESVLMVADFNSLINTAGKLSVDLVVADLSLPIPGKANIVREFKRFYPDLKLIVTSIHDEPAVLKEVLTAGAEGFVLKRKAAIDLIPAVHAVIRGRIYVSPTSRGRKKLNRPEGLNRGQNGM